MTLRTPQATSDSGETNDRPWLKWYDAGVPHEVEVPAHSLDRFLTVTEAKYPERVATRFVGASLTYRQLDEEANRFAHLLIRLGVQKGDRVALLLPNSPQMIIAYYG